MVRVFIALLLLCALSGPAHAQYAAIPAGRVAQDGGGTIWGAWGAVLPGMGGGTAGTVFRWRSGQWQAQAVPGAAGFLPQALTRGDDGAVYAFWQTQQTPARSLITVHRGGGSRVLARFSDPVVGGWPGNGPPSLWAGVRGDVWVAGGTSVLYHISPGGDVTPFPLKPEQFFGGRLPDSNLPQASLSSLTDGQGRCWFWQDGGHYSGATGGLRGFLIWDGKALAYHPKLSSLPDPPALPGPAGGPSPFPNVVFTTLAPLDAHHLWLAVLGFPWQYAGHGGLYRLDTRTLAVTPVAPPEKDAFRNVTQVFRANGDWYAVATPQQGDRVPVLWRAQGAGWNKCLGHMEDAGGYSTGDRYPWLAEPRGTWLGVRGGAWWLPQNHAPAVRVDWRRGLNVASVSEIFRTPGGGVSAFGEGQGMALLPPSPPPLLPPRPNVVTGAMGGPEGLAHLIADPRRHLWGTRSSWSGSYPLDEWDGVRWRTHLTPKDTPNVTGLYACDTDSRVWLNTSTWNPAQPVPVYGIVIYDPLHDTWTNYVTLGDALKASAARPGLKLLPNHDEPSPPVFSENGQVTYVSNNTQVFLYDGHDWRHWEAHDILPGYDYGNLPYPPHFGPDGPLEVALKDQTWEWTPAGGWQQTGEQKPEKYVNPVPPGGPRGLWAIPAVDSLGAKWFVWQGAIYTAAHGLWVKQAALSGPGSPFWDGRGVEDVLRDPMGRLFFVTRPAGFYDFVVWSPPGPASPPAPRIRVTPLAASSVALHFSRPSPGSHGFLWRVNGGRWSAPQRAASVTLSDLAHGDYRVEAQTVGALLQLSARPSSAAFTIRAATPAQVARWVQTLLAGSDDGREAAAAGLSRQTDLALPALRAARAGASAEGLWWLDAVIQQIAPPESQTAVKTQYP